MRIPTTWRLVVLWSTTAVLCGVSGPAEPASRASRSDRVAAQRVIEEIRWRHRLWPASNTRPKPPLAEVLPESVLRSRAEEGSKKSAALERFWGVRVTGRLIQAEIDRMVAGSRAPEVLDELFAALGNDPTLIAEVIARPLVADRLLRERYERDERISGPRGTHAGAGGGRRSFDAWWSDLVPDLPSAPAPEYGYTIPAVPVGGCVDGTWTSMLTDIPFGRYYHTAIWTGSEMIVWGGWGANSAILGSGARYDPALDTWLPIEDDPAVPGRYRHAAVWTGTEMIVWGGGDSAATYTKTGAVYNPTTGAWRPTRVDTNTPNSFEHVTGVWTGSEAIFYGGSSGGGRYNPVTDTWIKVPLPSEPGRFRHSAVWTGTEMLIWGGSYLPPSAVALNIGRRYNPTTGLWSSMPVTPATPAARIYHSTVWTGSEMIVWGGAGTSGLLNSGGRFNPATNTWTPTLVDGTTPAPRSHGTAVWAGSVMVVWGGQSASGQTESSGGGVYDPAVNTWRATRDDASTPAARSDFTSVWTGSEMIVWGGFSTGIGFVNTGGRYDPVADTWQPTAIQYTAPEDRWNHTAVWTGSEMIVWGGWGPGAGGAQSGVRYDPATDSWGATSIDTATPSGRAGHRAVWTGSEMIVWGGSTNPGPGLAVGGGRYNPQSDTWATVRSDATAPAPRTDHTAIWTGQEMIVWGGRNPTTFSTGTGGRYDPVTDTWNATRADGTHPFPRDQHSAVWTGQKMIIWGGYGAVGDGHLITGALYDPKTDTWTPTSSAPTGRRHHTAVWTGREMIVWGGFNVVGRVNSGSRYDLLTDSWTATEITASTPPPQADHTAVWTGREMIIWGSSGARYDPATATWAPVQSNWLAPGTGTGHAAVWDGNEMIVWSGLSSNTGGRYCACPGPVSVYYQDTDGDGHGESSVSVPSCSPPSGYADQAGDCGDLDPGSWTVPGEVRDLMIDAAGSITWLPPLDPGGLPSALRYDLIRSTIPWDFDSAATCLATDSSEASALDPDSPVLGGVLYYDARARNGCAGEGPLGTDSSGNRRTGCDCP